MLPEQEVLHNIHVVLGILVQPVHSAHQIDERGVCLLQHCLQRMPLDLSGKQCRVELLTFRHLDLTMRRWCSTSPTKTCNIYFLHVLLVTWKLSRFHVVGMPSPIHVQVVYSEKTDVSLVETKSLLKLCNIGFDLSLNLPTAILLSTIPSNFTAAPQRWHLKHAFTYWLTNLQING